MRVVADASPEAGLGHLARCTALAYALYEERFDLELIALGAEERIHLDDLLWLPSGRRDPDAGSPPDLLVLDTYDREAWDRMASQPHGRLVTFSDAVPDPAAVDVVIAVDESPFEAPELVLSGPRYACLRNGFWHLRTREIEDEPDGVLVTTGGSDPGALAEHLVEGIAERCPEVPIELIWGPGFGGVPPLGTTVLEQPRSLCEPLLRASVVVCAGGQTMLEAAATGTPAVVVEAAPNQRRQIAALASRQAILAVSAAEVPETVEGLLDSPSWRRELSERAHQVVDGRGALRVAAELATLVSD